MILFYPSFYHPALQESATDNNRSLRDVSSGSTLFANVPIRINALTVLLQVRTFNFGPDTPQGKAKKYN